MREKESVINRNAGYLLTDFSKDLASLMKAERRRSTSAFGDRFPEFCSVICIGPRGSGIDFLALSVSNKPVEACPLLDGRAPTGRQTGFPQNWRPTFCEPRWCRSSSSALAPLPPGAPATPLLLPRFLFFGSPFSCSASPPLSVPFYCCSVSSLPALSLFSIPFVTCTFFLSLSPKMVLSTLLEGSLENTAAKLTFSFKGKACISNCS